MGPPSDALTGDGRLPHAQWSSDSGMSCFILIQIYFGFFLKLNFWLLLLLML